MASEQLVQYGAERPNVGSLVGPFSSDLFRTHVSRRAHDHARLRQRREGSSRFVVVAVDDSRVGLAHRRQAEIQHLDDAGWCDEDIRRLQVTMDDPFFMGGNQGGRNLPRVANRRFGGQRPEDRYAGHQLHHQRAVLPRLFDAIDLRDVGMVQRSQYLGLALEPSHALGITATSIGQYLESDVALQLGIRCL